MPNVAEFAANIAPEILGTARPLTDAIPHPDNIRKHNIPAIARSLHTHGQRSPIVVQSSTGYIVKGNGTWEAARTLGWEELAQVWQEMTDEQAITYLLADNKASDLSGYHRDNTKKLLERMAAGPGLFDTLWEMDELENLVAESGIPETDAAEFKGDYADAGEEGEAREAKSKAPGEKMKEIPVVLTQAEHAKFVEYVRKLQKVYGTTGVIATIVEGIRRAAEGVPSEAVPIGDAEEVRLAVLKECRDYFLTDGRPSWSPGAIASFFQAAMHPLQQVSPLRDDVVGVVVEVPGQLSMEEMLG